MLISSSHFNPRSPHGERPEQPKPQSKSVEFQSTLPARGATFCADDYPFVRAISIHAPRTGSDATGMHPFSAMRISIHAPRTGSDYVATGEDVEPEGFQSTLPARGATKRLDDSCIQRRAFQSTLPARGATSMPSPSVTASTFQSTLPARGATSRLSRTPQSQRISIHAPRTGSDGASSNASVFFV